MRKRTLQWTFLGLVLLLISPFKAVSQSSYADSVREVKQALIDYEARLSKIDQYLMNYDDCAIYSRNYDECVEFTDYLYEANKPMILENAALSKIWFNIKDLRRDIDEKMVVFKREQETENMKRDLRMEFSQISSQYDQLVVSYQQLDQIKRKAGHDTLQSLKKRDSEMFGKYSSKKLQNESIIAEDSSLKSLCNHIETLHKTINEANDIETIKWGDVIFKVTIVAALLFFLINLIVSKKKLKNQLNGKKNKHIPSI